MNSTDKKILKWSSEGCSPERIAKKLGRPGDIERVQRAMEKAKSE